MTPLLRLIAAILFTAACCVGMILVATRARGLLMMGGLAIAFGGYWIASAWRDWKRPARSVGGRGAG